MGTLPFSAVFEPAHTGTGEDETRFWTGIERLDSQHRQLVQKLGDLERAVGSRCSNEVICPFLAEFADLAIRHFEDEELVLEAVGYPRLKAHRSEHRRLLLDLDEFARQLAREGRLPFPEILRFLTDWVMRHMVEWDRDYLAYLDAPVATGTEGHL